MHRARYCFTNSVRLSNAGNVSEQLHILSNYYVGLYSSGIILVFWAPLSLQNSEVRPLADGKILRFSTEIAVHLGNGTR